MSDLKDKGKIYLQDYLSNAFSVKIPEDTFRNIKLPLKCIQKGKDQGQPLHS